MASSGLNWQAVQLPGLAPGVSGLAQLSAGLRVPKKILSVISCRLTDSEIALRSFGFWKRLS